MLGAVEYLSWVYRSSYGIVFSNCGGGGVGGGQTEISMQRHEKNPIPTKSCEKNRYTPLINALQENRDNYCSMHNFYF